MTETAPHLRIATRSSELALWQANHVADGLRTAHPGLSVELVQLTTHADRHLEVPIAEIGGKGVFAKEVQHAVLDGRADIAVHSAKDLTAVPVAGLVLAAVPERGDARDALAGGTLSSLAEGAIVGTGSARRQVQLAALRPDLNIVGLRGNIATRLAHIDDGDMRAIVVAYAALERLGMTDRAAQIFPVDEIIPQVAQGALAIECRSDDAATIALVAALEDSASRLCVDAERAFLARLGGDCNLPAGAHATLTDDGSLTMTGLLAAGIEGPIHRHRVTGEASTDAAVAAGTELADVLRAAVGE